MERTMEDEILHICAVCYRGISKDSLAARDIDGFWACSSNCVSKLLKEKKMWTPTEWDELCKIQALYEERKRRELNSGKIIFSKIT